MSVELFMRTPQIERRTNEPTSEEGGCGGGAEARFFLFLKLIGPAEAVSLLESSFCEG